MPAKSVTDDTRPLSLVAMEYRDVLGLLLTSVAILIHRNRD